MGDPQVKQWGLISAMRDGVRDLFPTRKTKSAMWGVVGLGVVITYMELIAATLFSALITNLENQSSAMTALTIGGFLVTFAAIRGVSYFQSVYRLTVFGKALRQITSTSAAAETWRWPMAIALVGMMGQIARLFAVTFTVTSTEWMYGVLLMLCSVVAVLVVNRTGRKQYEIHHQFVEAKKSGNPPSAAERIGTRIRAGERAGLVAVGPVLVYVAALGVGAATGRVTARSALVLFIAGRMASNMYGSLSMASMRYIRAQVNVEAYGGDAPPRAAGAGAGVVMTDDEVLDKILSGPYAWLPPAQAFAHLIDDGHVVGDLPTIGRVGREAGFGPTPGLRKHAPTSRPDRIVAVAPNQVWMHEVYALPISDAKPPGHVHVLIDVFSRMIVRWKIVGEVADADIRALHEEACRHEGLATGEVALCTTATRLSEPHALQDLLKSLRVVRTLLWTAPDPDQAPPKPDRPIFPTRFGDRAAAEAWVASFVTWHNEVFYQPDVGYLHPADVHAGLADVITTKRQGALDAVAEANGVVGRLPDEWLPPEEAWVGQMSISTVPQDLQTSEEHVLDEDEDS